MNSLPSTGKDPHFERILASYLDSSKIELSALEIDLKTRWEAAFSLLLNFHSREQAVKVLREQFGYNLATAYRDINKALSLFGDITKSRKEGWRYIIFEYNQKLFQMATKDRDLKEMGKCLDRMIRLADLDKEESMFDPDKIKAQSFEIKISKTMETALMKAITNGPIDMNNLEAEDIPHEPAE
ncbi:hypothetical protein SAMN05192545_2895 [Maribacter dokdonensis]|uniref:Uncharacterized protein n=1 Tax=Maribacter dokdonensis TaxID=320912 RepID=A0ABY0UT68_9FLAO|nr:hypothetical protein [Maribacter dokdonensis]SDT15619.1 hypothetical protein SAMN05192545_2895 [Maribacter dokdonensis]